MAKLQKVLFLNRKGQSLIEYILLLLVISSVAFGIFNHPKLKQFIGPNSSYFNALRRGMEYSYRYGNDLPDGDYSEVNFDNSTNAHPLYLNKAEGQSRFFANEVEYGGN